MSVQFFEKNHRYKIDGVWATSVSTALKGIPKEGVLTRWAAKTVARHALDNISTLAADVEHHGYGPRLSMLAGVPNEKRDRAALRGTEVHELAERYIGGEEIEVAPEVMPYVRGYAEFVEQWNPKPLHEEMIVASRAHKIRGPSGFHSGHPRSRGVFGGLQDVERDLRRVRAAVCGVPVR